MLWIFAYGSLMFRPAFQYVGREPAYIEGFVRRFWQGSTDHRGVPGAPGRVATLASSETSRCYGLALSVSRADAPAVLDSLDFRERGGYTRLELPLRRASDGSILGRGLVYIADPDNESWLGPASAEVIAAQVRRSHGPSGPNADYVIGVARVLLEMGTYDDHVFDIADRVDPTWRSFAAALVA